MQSPHEHAVAAQGSWSGLTSSLCWAAGQPALQGEEGSFSLAGLQPKPRSQGQELVAAFGVVLLVDQEVAWQRPGS